MNTKLLFAIRIIFGLLLLVFGSNKFLNFMSPGEMPEAAMSYFGAIMSTKTLTLVAIVEILAGLSLLLNKYSALMMLILMSISVNAVLFHAFLAPEGIAPAVLLLVLNLVMLYSYRDKYQPLLK